MRSTPCSWLSAVKVNHEERAHKVVTQTLHKNNKRSYPSIDVLKESETTGFSDRHFDWSQRVKLKRKNAFRRINSCSTADHLDKPTYVKDFVKIVLILGFVSCRIVDSSATLGLKRHKDVALGQD